VSVPATQRETAALLQRLAGRAPIETHISAVFVGADTVWKLKKAVRLSFLDFTAVAARRRFLLREIEVNRPAAPDLYRDVVPMLRQADGTLALGAPAQASAAAVDWVLRMAPVPAADFVDAIAARGDLTPGLLDAIADAVASYHQILPPITRIDAAAALDRVARGNADAACEAGLPQGQVQEWLAAIAQRIAQHGAWLAARAAAGFVRRAHGDLHLGNLCLWHGRPVLFDAIEFDETMATIDLGYDLAFLLMDLDHRVSRAAANRVLNRYVARTGDAALTTGLPVYLSLRAMIRAHVEARRSKSEDAASYLAAAAAYLAPAPPILIAIGGLPGTGKSTLARALAPGLGAAPGALILRSDEIRKRKHGVSPEQRLPDSAYTEAASDKVFTALSRDAATVTAGGHSCIADAAFLRPAQRSAVAYAASNAGTPFQGLWLTAPLPELEARIARRVGDASDATIAVLHSAAQHDQGGDGWVPIDARDADLALAQAHQAVQSCFGSHRRREPC
jgi:aminoglycoside phosphotransferase family enzyme/predicted kinase